jgi:hypothetical protein
MQLNPAVSKVYEMSLFEGESDGLIQFKLGEDVLCYKISKDYFDKYKEDNDIKKLKSIYVLYGKGKFYVGQAGIRKDDTAITSRIKEHLKDPTKDFVEEIVFFCHSNNRWNGGELDYLEASLIEYFKAQGFPLYKEQNNETKDPYLDQSVQFKYEKHFREIKIMLDILGYNMIRKLICDDLSYADKSITNAFGNSEGTVEKEKVYPTMPGYMPKGKKFPKIIDNKKKKAGELFFEILYNLSVTGYVFDDRYFDECLKDIKWCRKKFGVGKFLLEKTKSLQESDFYNENDKEQKTPRYRRAELIFGTRTFYVTTQVYDKNKQRIKAWYEEIERDSKEV